MRGEHDGRALGYLVELLDEHRAAGLEVGDDVLVVHDLLAHVDRRAVQVQGLLDGDHRAVDAGAVAARGGQADAFLDDTGIPRSTLMSSRLPAARPNPRVGAGARGGA